MFHYCNRTEKRAIEAEVRSLCEAADVRLNVFVETLNLECLEMYKDVHDENIELLELPQVNIYLLNIYYFCN